MTNIIKLNTAELPQEDMIIIVKIKQVYGEDKVYPSCEKAHLFARMLCQMSFTPVNINHIKKLGYTVLVEQTQPKEL